jgi:hypothetical protein
MVTLYCKDHGAIYVDRKGGSGKMIEASNMEPQRDDISKPTPGEEILCPLCKGEISYVFFEEV